MRHGRLCRLRPVVVDGGRIPVEGAEMLGLWFIITVAFVLTEMHRINRQPRYVCPQCGSKRAGAHSKGCSWRT